MERVVVTGLGIISPLGCSIADFWQGLCAGRSGVVALTDESFAGLRTRIGALVTGFDASAHFDRKEAHRLSRSSQLAVAAAVQALADAQLTAEQTPFADVAVIIGSTIGGFAASDPHFKSFYQRGHTSPLTIPVSMNVGPAANVSIRFGFQGPLLNVDAACASSAHCIGNAFQWIRSGQLDVAVTGGADTPFSPGVVDAWCSMRALSERNDTPAEACRPFSADRDGLVLGEGAAILVLESESHARRRGAHIWAEVLGYGAASDGHHIAQPTPGGPARAMQKALASASLEPSQIDYINAHGTATQLNDKIETAAIKAVFGQRAYSIPVVGNKAAFGHAMGASGALELASCILSLRDQLLPPTLNRAVPDPECDLDYVTEGQRAHAVRYAMSNAFAFGGSNAALIVGRHDPA
jgi:beta-ketoacyl-acyl-carrier-protein synthase II